MKLPFLIWLLIMFLRLNSQEPQELKLLLESKNYFRFSNYIDSFGKTKRSSLAFESDDTKPLFDKVSSRALHFTELIDYNGLGNVNNYFIQVLINGDEIAYYRMESNGYEKDKGIVRPATKVDTFKNEVLYNKVFQDYRTLYQISLDETELWSNDIVYGWGCGIGGEPPEPAQKVLGFVKNRQIDSIRNWLRSPIPAKQVYAIKAFSLLGSRYLNQEDKHIIEIVVAKNVTVPVCSGCIGSSQPIKQLVGEIKFSSRTNSILYVVIAISVLCSIAFLMRAGRAAT